MPKGYILSVPYLLAESKKSEAISLLNDAYDNVNEKNRILELLTTLYVSLKDFDAAISKVRSAIHENGETAELNMLVAKIQLSSKKIEDAKITLHKIIDIKPGWNEPYLLLANIYTAVKHNQKAVDILQQGLAELKSDLKLSFRLAKIYESTDDFNAAINEYEKAYEKNPGNVILINNLAILLSKDGNDENNIKRAKELADKLKNSRQSVILDTVGWVYYKAADYVGAVDVLKAVVEKSPDVALFNYHLGMALFKADDKPAAKIYLSRSLSYNSDFPGKDDAEAHLKKIQQ